MYDIALSVAAGVVGAGAMWAVTAIQHHLYTRPEDRTPADGGSRRLARRASIVLVAAAAIAVAARPDHYDALPAAATSVAMLGLLLAASTDLERRLIPDRVSLGLAAFALVVCWSWPDRTVADLAIGGAVALAFGGTLFVVGDLFGGALGVRATPFGLGDVKLMVGIGLLTGWPAVMMALLIGVGLAGIPGLVLTLAGQGRRVFPYGPFLVLGALVVLAWPEHFV